MLSVESIDALDARILLALDDDPDATILSLSRALGVARNTVHARLRRLMRSGALQGFSRRVDPVALGYNLVAFVSLEISQASGRDTMIALQALPEVVEMHATTGEADLLAKVVARDPRDLHRVTTEMLAIPGVVRSSTAISLDEVMPLRMRALLEAASRG
jgi:DNA-binding Lrp family transcriptional regulator